MLEIVYSPQWFYGKDLPIDVLSLFVLFLIGFSSVTYYRLNRKKKHLLLAISFFLLAASFLFKILTNFTIYYRIFETHRLGFLTITYEALRASNVLFTTGFFLYRVLMLVGLYFLYAVYVKQEARTIVITSYLLLISSYFSRSAYYVFHLTALLFLLLITSQYWRNYRATRHATNQLLFASFSLITLSQLVFIFIKLQPLLYVIAELVQLAGYILLLTTFVKVLNDGKKKGAARHHH